MYKFYSTCNVILFHSFLLCFLLIIISASLRVQDTSPSSYRVYPPSLSLSCFSWPFSTLPGDSPTFLPHSFVKDPTFQGSEDQLANHSPDKPASGLRLAELQLAGGSPRRYIGYCGGGSGNQLWERICIGTVNVLGENPSSRS